MPALDILAIVVGFAMIVAYFFSLGVLVVNEWRS